MEEARELARKIPCVLSPNMSVGVNVMFKVVADLAAILGDDYDLEVVEAHHRMKKDAPSGTAMKLGQVLAEAVNRNFGEVGVFARKGLIGERTRKEIGMQTIRAGDIIGEHTVIFGGLGERLEVTHRAHSRDNFARGAVRAARWVVGQKPGLYDMQNVLGIKDGLVKSPSAALRFNFVVAAHLLVRFTPQFLRALHLELFTKPFSETFL